MTLDDQIRPTNVTGLTVFTRDLPAFSLDDGAGQDREDRSDFVNLHRFYRRRIFLHRILR